jgi:hypothetical protein
MGSPPPWPIQCCGLTRSGSVIAFDCRIQIPCRDYRVRSLREAAPIRKSGLLCFGRLTRLASVNSVLVVRWKLTPSPSGKRSSRIR